MPAALSASAATRNPNQLSRFTWESRLPDHHVIALADPALGMDDSILGAWFLHPTTDLLEEMSTIVREHASSLGILNEEILFYGSSLGGYGALSMASFIPGSSAIAEIPQIDVAQWHVASAIRAMEEKILGVSFENFRTTHAERINLLNRFEKNGTIPPFAIITNKNDASYAMQTSFMNLLENCPTKKIGQQLLISTDIVSGHRALSRDLALDLITSWSKNKQVADCVFLESIS